MFAKPSSAKKAPLIFDDESAGSDMEIDINEPKP